MSKSASQRTGRGKCEGGGDRKGKGGCKCDYNYKGDVCSECKNTDFFLKTHGSETDKPECTRCHYSCLVSFHSFFKNSNIM